MQKRVAASRRRRRHRTSLDVNHVDQRQALRHHQIGSRSYDSVGDDSATDQKDWKGHPVETRRDIVRRWCLLVLTSLGVLATWQVWGPQEINHSRVLRESQTPQRTLYETLSGIPLSHAPYSVLPYYSPRRLTRSEVDLHEFFGDSHKQDDDDENNNHRHPPILHFVHSRFMQEQGNLTALGMARFHLFAIFSFPTMVAQTTDNFLWLIRVDPALDAAVTARMRRLVAPHPHVYLIASNRNFRINQDFPGAWRDDAQASDLRSSRLYTGDPTRLARALAIVDDVLILDTRLDADDGLHVDYLRTVQQAARTDFLERPTTLKWKYWCARRHLEWHWTLPQIQSERHDVRSSSSLAFGTLLGTQLSNMCITPGITVAFPVGVQEADVPVYGHHELLFKLKQLPYPQRCSQLHPEMDCLAFVSAHSFEAVRSRTPTSAGMLKVATDSPAGPESEWLAYAFWDALHDDFGGITRSQLAWMQSYLTQHLRQIGRDNLHGQCTTGHSCKPEAKRDLERLVALVAESSMGHSRK